MGRLQDWWTEFWDSAYHKEIDGPLTKRRVIPLDEAELVVEVEGADELSAKLADLADILRDMDWGQISATGGFASDVLFPEDREEEKLLIVGGGTLEVDEKRAAAIRAMLDQGAQSTNQWADLIWLSAGLDDECVMEFGRRTPCGDEHEPAHIEVGHRHSTSWPIPVKVIGASLSDSQTPPYDPAEHKTLEDIRAEANVMAHGIPMALFGGECCWWTTDINACYMDSLTESGCGCKRPCCPHCGEPLVMAPLGDFLDKANEYAHTFGDAGLWALELAHAHNLGRLMCLNEWDLYASVASLRLC